MNLVQMQTDWYEFTEQGASPAAAVIARGIRYFNQTQRMILGDKAFGVFRRKVLTCASVANSPFMTTPQAAVRLYTLLDRTNQWVLDPVSLQDVRRFDPGLTSTTSYPDRFFIENYSSCVSREPSAAFRPFVVSDDATDNTQKAFIEGTIGGYYRTASVNLNGLTPAALSALTTWDTITKFYIQKQDGTTQAAVGNVTLTEGSGGNELSRIPPGRSFPRYTMIHLYPTPATSSTYYADVDLHVEDMASADDEPLIPEDFHWMVVSGAKQLEYRRKQRLDLYAAEKAIFTDGWRNLKLWIAQNPGVARNDQTPRRFSQLGPYFPPGS